MTRSTFRIATKVLAGLGLAAFGLALWHTTRADELPTIALADLAPAVADATLPAWPEDDRLVADSQLGFRPRQGSAWPTATEEARAQVLGLFGTPLNDPISGPRILIVGSDFLTGVGPEAAVTSRLQTKLRQTGHAEASALDGSCPGYSPYQMVLRAQSLVDRLDPQSVLVVIDPSTDLARLEDPSRPHLDPSGFEVPARAGSAPDSDPTDPTRLDALQVRLQRSMAMLRELARGRERSVLVVILGSPRDPRWHDLTVQSCRGAHVAYLDLPEIENRADPDVHEQLANALAPRLTSLFKLR